MGGGGSQPSGNTTTVQKSDPWSGQVPFLTGGDSNGTTVPGVLPEAAKLYQSGGPQYYPGQTYATPTDAQTQGLNATQGVAGSNLNGIDPTAQNYITGQLNGSKLMAGNPYFSNMADSVKASVEPGLMAQFSHGNAFASPGTAYGVSKGVSDAVGNLAYTNYQNEENNQAKSALLAPTIGAMPYTDTSQLYNSGSTQQTLNQNQINDTLARYNYGQQLPYQTLNQYANSVNGNYGGTSTLTSPYYQGNSNSALGALGGGLLGYGLGGSGGGMFGMGAGSILGSFF